jgi:hypothetical protein
MLAPNRIVAILTPLVFAPLAGAVCAWVADNVPGASISQDQLTNIFIAGALVALAPAAQWLHGWQKYETQQAETERAVELANIAAGPAALAQGPAAMAGHDADAALFDDQATDDLDEFDEFLDVGDGDEELLTEEQPATAGS